MPSEWLCAAAVCRRAAVGPDGCSRPLCHPPTTAGLWAAGDHRRPTRTPGHCLCLFGVLRGSAVSGEGAFERHRVERTRGQWNKQLKTNARYIVTRGTHLHTTATTLTSTYTRGHTSSQARMNVGMYTLVQHTHTHYSRVPLLHTTVFPCLDTWGRNDRLDMFIEPLCPTNAHARRHPSARPCAQ